MDKITLTVLCTLFFFNYSSLLILSLFILMLFGVIDITYITLFLTTLLGVYYTYGLSGLFILSLSTLSFITSGYMCIFNVSFNEIIKSISYSNENTTYDYSILLANIYDKTGLSEKKIKTIINNYKKISSLYDKFCSNLYILLCTFRVLTEDIIGFRELYNLTDKCIEFKKRINHIQQLFSLSSSVTVPNNISAISNELINQELNSLEPIELNNLSTNDNTIIDNTQIVEEHISQEPVRQRNSINNDPFTSLFNGNNLDFNNIMAMNHQMEKQLSSLPPEQKQQLDKMAMDMMGGLFGNLNSKKN